MKNIKNRISAFYVALCALVALVITAPQANALPVEFDPAEMIAQVTATAGDVLPFVVALVAAGLVFKLIKRWAR